MCLCIWRVGCFLNLFFFFLIIPLVQIYILLQQQHYLGLYAIISTICFTDIKAQIRDSESNKLIFGYSFIIAVSSHSTDLP